LTKLSVVFTYWVFILGTGVHVLEHSTETPNSLVNVISYDLVPPLHQVLMEKNFQVVIMDESHNIKNKETQRTKHIQPLVKV